MKKIYAFLLFAAIAGFTLASCSKTEPDTPTTPTTQPSEPKDPTVVKHTIPFKITVALPTDTKVTLEDETNFKYDFSSGDQILVSADGVTGSLAYTSGKEFNGSITYEDGKLVSGSTVLNLTLVSAGKGSAMTSADYSSAVSTVSITDAIQKYSNFTGSLTYSNTPGNIKINLTQISAFLKFSLTLDGYPDGEYTVKVIDDSHGAGSPFVGGNVSVSSSTVVFYVALLTDAGKVTLSNAKLQITGGPNNISKTLPFGSASQAILKNMCYPVTRTIDDTFTIRAREDGTTITYKLSTTKPLQFRKDGKGVWADYSSAISLDAGHYVSFRGKNKAYGESLFDVNKNCYIYGNLMSLCCTGDGDVYTPRTEFAQDEDSKNAFRQAFYNATWVDIPAEERLLIAADKLQQNSYYSMFEGAKGLTKGPVFDIDHQHNGSYTLTLAQNASASCFYKMFLGCTSLTSVTGHITVDLGTSGCRDMFQNCSLLSTIPNITISAVGQYGCRRMFQACTSLSSSSPITLSAMTVALQGYWYMFYGCTSLTDAPDLPATSVAEASYEQMFSGCTSLQTSPVVSATTLTGSHSCWGMFYGCTSLISAPVLSAATLTDHCYEQMFRGCTSLTTAPDLQATVLSVNCYNQMFFGCTSLTVAPVLNATTLVTGCYGDMFKNCYSLASVTCLATSGIGSCTTNWMEGTGKNVVGSKVLSIASGTGDSWGSPGNNSKVPTGWTTVVYTP